MSARVDRRILFRVSLAADGLLCLGPFSEQVACFYFFSSDLVRAQFFFVLKWLASFFFIPPPPPFLPSPLWWRSMAMWSRSTVRQFPCGRYYGNSVKFLWRGACHDCAAAFFPCPIPVFPLSPSPVCPGGFCFFTKC